MVRCAVAQLMFPLKVIALYSLLCLNKKMRQKPSFPLGCVETDARKFSKCNANINKESGWYENLNITYGWPHISCDHWLVELFNTNISLCTSYIYSESSISKGSHFPWYGCRKKKNLTLYSGLYVTCSSQTKRTCATVRLSSNLTDLYYIVLLAVTNIFSVLGTWCFVRTYNLIRHGHVT